MYAFIHIPKTGGSSLRHLLRCAFGAGHCDLRPAPGRRQPGEWLTAPDLRLAHRVYPRLRGLAGHRVTCFSGLEAAGLGPLRYFTLLREPRARFLSHFRHAHRGRPAAGNREAFLRFCADPWQRNLQTRWLAADTSRDAAIDVLEHRIGFTAGLEYFDECLPQFAHWLGAPEFQPLPLHRNAAPHRTAFDPDLDPEAVGLCAEANAADLAVYRYWETVILPRQRAAHGAATAPSAAPQPVGGAVQREPLWARCKRNLLYKPLLHLAPAGAMGRF
jgi:hypothetical protein